jgi:hypothetical protein
MKELCVKELVNNYNYILHAQWIKDPRKTTTQMENKCNNSF